ncbi:MAG: hypothetical protein HKM89_15360 [Gemmatimonadales bacterium]|nr:hypothetical protein [Gemmatimonadales bacterium]
MTYPEFEALIHQLVEAIPADYLRGVAQVSVSPRAVPHPESPGVFTLGECVPLPIVTLDEGGEESESSRIVLYHGSFAALAQLDEEFDWEEEAWETLTHELRHHLEWRAGTADLETYDWAAEQNFARRDGEPFDPGFYLDGEQLALGVFDVDGDTFIDRRVSELPDHVEFEWQRRIYRVTPPADASLPAFLILTGVQDPPARELVLVLRRRPGLRSLLKPGEPYEAAVKVEGQR